MLTYGRNRAMGRESRAKREESQSDKNRQVRAPNLSLSSRLFPPVGSRIARSADPAVSLCALLMVCMAAGAGCAYLTPLNTGLSPEARREFKSDFHTFDEILQTLSQWQRRYGLHAKDLAKIDKIGKSWEGRPIYAIKISRNASKDDPVKPDILVTGGVHACEWIGIETAMYFAKRLLEDYETDDYVRYIVDNTEIWIVPVVNPDGFVYSQEEPDRGHRLWRKNRRPLPDGQVGVDLNRNYPYEWRLSGDMPHLIGDDIGGSDDTSSKFYRGAPHPDDPTRPKETEKEIRALITLVDDPAHNFVLYIDYHSFSEKILYPHAYKRERPRKDYETYEFLAGGMAHLINRHRRTAAIPGFGRRYRHSQGSRLYLEPITGSSVDFFYGSRGIMSLCVELSPSFSVRRYLTGSGFMLDPHQIVPVALENFNAFLFAADWATGPGCVRQITVRQDGREVFQMTQSYGGETKVARNSGELKQGRAVVTLVFNKPMLLSREHRMVPEEDAGVSRLKLLDRLGRLHRLVGPGAWTRTRYGNDTFTGVISIHDDAHFDFSRGAVVIGATDGIGFAPDLRPATRPVYLAGEGMWLNYECGRYERAPINQAELAGDTARR